jgi:hypothetical protein
MLDSVRDGSVELPNNNFDVGENTGPGKYRMNDEAHAKLLDKLAEKNFLGVSSEVKAELVQFFADTTAAYATKRNAKAWAKVQSELQQLKSGPAAPVVADASGAAGIVRR